MSSRGQMSGLSRSLFSTSAFPRGHVPGLNSAVRCLELILSHSILGIRLRHPLTTPSCQHSSRRSQEPRRGTVTNRGVRQNGEAEQHITYPPGPFRYQARYMVHVSGAE